MNLEQLEKDLRKRLEYPYKWGTRQTNALDQQTNYIYSIPRFDDLLEKLRSESAFIQNYAMNRWFNYNSAMAVEYMFAQNSVVTPHHNRRNKLIDFSLCDINFDHKTSVFPKSFGFGIDYAMANKELLIQWLYVNQSQEGRKHLGNRLFLIMYDSVAGEHWKIKAQLERINKAVDAYINNFQEENLITLDIENNSPLSDTIFVCV